MASGRIDGKCASPRGAYSYYIKWTSTTNTAGNYSTVNVKTYYATSNTGWDFDTVATRLCTITCDGQYREIWKRINCYNWQNGNPYLVQEENFTVYHNTDGNKTITISATTNGEAGSWGPDASSASGNAKLDFIPRESTVSNVTGTIGKSVAINISKAYSGFTSTIKVNGVVVADKTSANTVNYTIPVDYYGKIPNAKSGSVSITCDTYNGSTKIGATKSATLTYYVDEATSKPTIAPTVVDVNSTTIALTNNSAVLVRHLSTARAVVNASAKNKATISSNWIKNGNTEAYAATKDFANIGSNKFSFWAQDSRGYQVSKDITTPWIEYSKLSCNVDATINPANGEGTVTITGNAFDGEFRSGYKNAITSICFRWKEDGGSWQSWVYPTAPTISGGKYTCKYIIPSSTGLTYKKKYYFQAYAKDRAMEIYSAEIYVDNLPIANWEKDFFQFNVPVKGNIESATAASRVKDCDNGEHIRLTYQPSYSASQSPYICTMMRNSAANNAPEMRTSTAAEVAKMIQSHLSIPSIPSNNTVCDVQSGNGWTFHCFNTGLAIGYKNGGNKTVNFDIWGSAPIRSSGNVGDSTKFPITLKEIYAKRAMAKHVSGSATGFFTQEGTDDNAKLDYFGGRWLCSTWGVPQCTFNMEYLVVGRWK